MQMALYSPPVNTDEIATGNKPNATTSGPPNISESHLNSHVGRFQAKCKNLRRQMRVSPSNQGAELTSSNEEHQRRLQEEAEDRAREAELNDWLTMGCMPDGIDTDFTEILHYYKVCTAFFLYTLLTM
ncbi:hypothetical protein CPB86DRAFT_280482 [Serendipita vermifera]|nr:hypothetical protein CPB86DRAFT_280482 [Serendipita vermifera]